MLPDQHDQLPFALPDIGAAEIAGVMECLQSGWLTSGRKVKEFEQAFAAELGVAHAVSVSSATAASLLLFEAMGLCAGDEIIFPTWTFSGPPMMAHKLGATVVLTDVDAYDFNLDVHHVARHATPRTRVVVPTHFAGKSCDTQSLVEWCRPHGIGVIDDAAHALPSSDDLGRKVGKQGALATFFSFYATKTLTTGEGGMIVTEDGDLARELRNRRSHGMNRDMADRHTNKQTGWRYDIAHAGWKANMTDIAAAIGLAQLSRYRYLALARRLIAARYTNDLAKAEADGKLTLPKIDWPAQHAWHLYPICVLGDRDRFIAEMGRKGIQCSMHFIPLHQHSFWREHAKNGYDRFPNADRLAQQEVSLPIFSKMTGDDVDRMVRAANEVAYSC
jgi:dTDP-4-amino-4,6-dideoxygalactose transaminase